MAQGQYRRNCGVFSELGLAEREKDPTDPTGKRWLAICRCKVDKDDPTKTCNKKMGKIFVFLNVTEIYQTFLSILN